MGIEGGHRQETIITNSTLDFFIAEDYLFSRILGNVIKSEIQNKSGILCHSRNAFIVFGEQHCRLQRQKLTLASLSEAEGLRTNNEPFRRVSL